MTISRRNTLIGLGGITAGIVVASAYFSGGFGNEAETQVLVKNNNSISHEIAIIISDPKGDLDYFSGIDEIEGKTQSEFDSGIIFGEQPAESAFVNILLDTGQHKRLEVDFRGVDKLVITIRTDESLAVEPK